MDWVHRYQLFLFDFDGILVNTEHLHYKAYQNMCLARGFTLPWDFPRYCQAAHYESTGLRDQIYEELPGLKEIEPSWDVLYPEKKTAYADLLKAGEVQLMPGVEELLKTLEEAKIKRCVVTHSPAEHVSKIRELNPLLNSIPNWITREHYSQPKPNPECYNKAISMLAEENDSIIGFEDTPRGLTALKGSSAQAVFVSKVPYPDLNDIVSEGVIHVPDMLSINENTFLELR